MKPWHRVGLTLCLLALFGMWVPAGRSLRAHPAWTEPPSGATFLWDHEAESGSLTGAMTVGSDGEASSGQYVYSPQASDDAKVTYSVTVPADSYYYLWARAKGTSWNNNSFWLQIDNRAEIMYEIPQFDGAWTWGWEVVHPDKQPADPFYLSAGAHTLQFEGREAYAGLDRLVLTDDPSYTPGGPSVVTATPSRTASPPATRYEWWKEAEEGEITAAMTWGNDLGASNCTYLHAPMRIEGSGVNFSFQVPQAGDYYVWARVRGLSWTDNSFWFSVDGGTPIYYEVDHSGSWNWTWDQVHPDKQPINPYYLGAGWHTMRFAVREENTRLDVVLVTNDPSYVPSRVMRCATPTPTSLPGGTCSGAGSLRRGQRVYGANNAAGSGDRIDLYPCAGWDESGPEYVYSFTTNDAGLVKVALSDYAVDLDLFVLSQSCDALQCVAYGDTVVEFNAVAGRTYFVAVDGCHGVTGSYTLTVGGSPGLFLPVVMAKKGVTITPTHTPLPQPLLISYDNEGSGDIAPLRNPNEVAMVRFSTDTRRQLRQVLMFLGSKAGEIEIVILNGDRQQIISYRWSPSIGDAPGYLAFEVPGNVMVGPGDFYVGCRFGSSDTGPAIGADFSAPDERSYLVKGDKFEPYRGKTIHGDDEPGDIMIRALVQ
jgi:hypothetical protein